jgi:TPP-dependent pyruvate/acetoin dehydrogenase alpha subunit
MRTRLYLEGLGRWSEADDEALWQRCRDEIQKAVQTAEAMPLPPPESMFDDIFEEPIWPLDEQKASLLRDLEGEA